jgi:hypothetical protein
MCPVQELKKTEKRDLEIDFEYKNNCKTYIIHRKFIEKRDLGMLTIGRNLDRTGQPIPTYLRYSDSFLNFS